MRLEGIVILRLYVRYGEAFKIICSDQNISVSIAQNVDWSILWIASLHIISKYEQFTIDFMQIQKIYRFCIAVDNPIRFIWNTKQHSVLKLIFKFIRCQWTESIHSSYSLNEEWKDCIHHSKRIVLLLYTVHCTEQSYTNYVWTRSAVDYNQIIIPYSWSCGICRREIPFELINCIVCICISILVAQCESFYQCRGWGCCIYIVIFSILLFAGE